MNNQKAMIELIKATSGQANVLSIPRPYIKYMGSLDGGLFLSQLIYWSDRGTDGWFYKTYAEWEDELTLSKYEVSKQVKILKEKGVLETKIKKANGAPTVYYRFSFDEFQKTIVKFLHYGKSSNLTIESKETSQSITEITTETTADIGPTPKNSNHKGIAQITNPSPEDTLNTLADQISGICAIDISTAHKHTREAIKTLTLALCEKEDITNLLVSFPDWWYANDWRGLKGQPPTPAQMGDVWAQFEGLTKEKKSVVSTDGGFYI